ncbi:glycosyltransferase family 4 protein [Psychroserpens sp. Hel_I_66]|uniref:glycosyltransferase family 4 protein n=1 Tax=Psychroserpens sp. Hel_I_66 TaxID=1250004 RepID=UPI0006490770|nr:glycosyltransferase family 4 protein [Psychroserpens sp. Hel_I_66]
MKKKLAIITTHPIQYNAPWFQLLAKRNNIEVKVFYTWSQSKTSVKDKNFGKQITWDIPLLEGYDYEFVENTAKNPGVHHFFGINCKQLIPKIEAYKPDAILVFGWNFISHLKALRYFKGKIPVWFRGDSTLLNEVPGFKTKLRRLALTRVYKYVDQALYVGEANKDYFLKHGLSNQQLLYVPHAIDNERFEDSAENHYDQQASNWRKELGFSNRDLVVLYAGKFEPNKQLHILLDAVIDVNNKKVNRIKLLLLGNGPLEQDLKTKAKPYDFVTFIPFQNQKKMPVVYRLGNVFCLPSVSETWGLAINESMASKRPAILSDKVGCAKDIIVHEKNGWVFDHTNKKELVEVLKSLDKESLKIMGEHAKERINNFSFDNIVEAIESALINE